LRDGLILARARLRQCPTQCHANDSCEAILLATLHDPAKDAA
jgi:hypothetical protein